MTLVSRCSLRTGCRLLRCCLGCHMLAGHHQQQLRSMLRDCLLPGLLCLPRCNRQHHCCLQFCNCFSGYGWTLQELSVLLSVLTVAWLCCCWMLLLLYQKKQALAHHRAASAIATAFSAHLCSTCPCSRAEKCSSRLAAEMSLSSWALKARQVTCHMIKLFHICSARAGKDHLRRTLQVPGHLLQI